VKITASLAAYEIRNPLPYLMHLVYQMQMNKVVSTIQGYVDSVKYQSTRSASLFTRIRNVGKKDAGLSSVTPKSVIAHVLKVLNEDLHASRIQVEVVCYDDSSLPATADEIQQILIYVIRNSIETMQGGGHILLRVRACTGWSSGLRGLRFTLADNGRGISGLPLGNLFQTFHTAKESEGSRLGLWLAKRIVESHNGKMAVRSSQRAVHHGTVYQVFLPLYR
jgi:two-component system sporulation sensor kinase C